MDENTTLMANLALVISLKSVKIKERVLLLTEPTADFIHYVNWLAKITPVSIFCNPRKGFMTLEQHIEQIKTIKKALTFTSGLFPFLPQQESCILLLKFEGNRNTERYFYRSSPLLTWGHFR